VLGRLSCVTEATKRCTAAWAIVRLVEEDTLVALSLSMGVERGFQLAGGQTSQWWNLPARKFPKSKKSAM